MNLRTLLFGKKRPKMETYADFWQWFQAHQEELLAAVRVGDAIEKKFLEPVRAKLSAIDDGIFLLVGVQDAVVELIFTGDGRAKTVPIVEALVEEAPTLSAWRFLAHKPANPSGQLALEMAGHTFSTDTLRFYLDQEANYPDDVHVVLVHEACTPENAERMTQGATRFLETYVGELTLLEQVDQLSVVAPTDAQRPLRPLSELSDAIAARSAQVAAQYENVRWNEENDNYVALEGALPNGLPVFAIVERDLLQWDKKPSYPWVMVVRIPYKGGKDTGLPSEKTYALLEEIEDRIVEVLPCKDGFLNIGRETADNARELYIACRTYRKPVHVLADIRRAYQSQLVVDVDIYHDKYWRGLERFQQIVEG